MLNKKHNPASRNCRFQAVRISEKTIDELKPAAGPEIILLDPPKKGPAEGVIASLCRRSPQKILHIFCGVNQIPESVRLWKLGGYEVSQVVPLDMFPGSANLETIILLTPGKDVYKKLP
jgi:tRNA/tmRNA/rRNA uracil-C5-methylase (TrmA/RlmC/RlmD family)